jgi:hypothetical protein
MPNRYGGGRRGRLSGEGAAFFVDKGAESSGRRESGANLETKNV